MAEDEQKQAAGTQAAAARMHAATGSTDGEAQPPMSEGKTAPAADEPAAAATAEEVGTELETMTSETRPLTRTDMLSRMIYTGCYALAYGVVYSAVFIVQSMPQENPFMHGFRDGGKAAVDELGAPAVASPAAS